MSNERKDFHIVLVEPEIPPNTGNIARTCAATGTYLHLVRPLGFDIDDRTVRRAGLDYWPFVKLTVHDSLAEFLSDFRDAPMYFVSTKGRHSYTDFEYEEGAMFLFGRETRGLPRELLATHEDRSIRIPMLPDEHLRSLNLANSANIVLFEALRQQNFPGLG
ncbi:MAG: tRNA (uridine(34)/cytosine(34)/5-carboxymethylaminomethyluridine(34)-2'-O)-methyltransferase TrmL [Clostridiales Family XIII bacterium]|jgi:tRNA (cytidine/uridine-2'-O-)-methyltransferase|nr:tRNA (uridine(34)/cytosine(34)/5-carboxymethylaminomethyluridine(34)-2'-O)-methyltransferase TrmL [Clostridiales Family XIII bacterium]